LPFDPLRILCPPRRPTQIRATKGPFQIERLTGGEHNVREGFPIWRPHDYNHATGDQATGGALPANDSDFAFEFKWDGIRAVVFLDRGRLHVQSRSLRNMTAEYPELAELGKQTNDRRLILDAELICIGDDGRPDFEAIQSRIGRGNPMAIQHRQCLAPATLMIFDALQGQRLVSRCLQKGAP
jgi:ATP-dependent DNA ligase